MGNYYSNSYIYEQPTCRICMRCQNNGEYNEDLLILTHTINTIDKRAKLLMRCSKNHLLQHYGNIEYIEQCAEQLHKKTNLKMTNRLKTLEKENEELKKKFNLIPSAPPNEDIIVAEAVVDKLNT